MIDCHTHLLPWIDDGSRSLQESQDILNVLSADGIKCVWATPHFYPDDTVQEFLAKRDAAYQKLMGVLESNRKYLPDIRLGAEVLLSVDTPKIEDLHKLCIQGTEYILIELPYSNWSEWVYEALYTIRVKHKLIPIIAHVERYETMQDNLDKINRLTEMDVLVQMNAYSLMGSKKSFAMRLIKNNIVQLLGSDAHRLKSAKPVAQGYQLIASKLGEQKKLELIAYTEAILNGHKVQKAVAKPVKKIMGFYR